MDVIVVGPCGSGKTTLVAALTKEGYRVRAVAQEHSAIPKLWHHGGEPAALVVLSATPMIITARRRADFPVWLHEQQIARLASAREHADLTIDTDRLTAQEVLTRVVGFLGSRGIKPQTQEGA